MEPVGAIILNCPGCGARLEIARDLAQFACAACGRALTVVRRGGTVALASGEARPSAGSPSDPVATASARQRWLEELAASQRVLDEKARTLQYLRHHLNDDPTGFEPRSLCGVWPTLWKSAVASAALVLAVLADQHEGVPLRGLLVGLVLPSAVGFGIRYLHNRRAAVHNARLAKGRKEAFLRNRQEVEKRIQVTQREHDEAARLVVALTERIAQSQPV
jgi:hypothetical protein